MRVYDNVALCEVLRPGQGRIRAGAEQEQEQRHAPIPPVQRKARLHLITLTATLEGN